MQRLFKFALCWFSGLAVLCGPVTASAQEATKPKKEAEKKVASAASLNTDQELLALEFARTHHPELATLLERLKSQHTSEYRAGLAEVFRSAERLQRLSKNLPDKHEFELADWKLTSRIRLIVARLKMSNDSTLEEELRTLLRERHENRLAALRAEREKSQKKAEKLQQTIDEQAARSEEIVEREFKALRQSSATPKAPSSPKEKNSP